MNMLKKVSLAAALAAGLLASGASSAAQICQGCQYRFVGDGATTPTVASYLGSYNPTTGGPLPTDSGDSGSFTHGGLGVGTFTDWWTFQVDPAGGGEWDATFNPSSAISNFKVEIFKTTGLTTGSGLGSTCSAISDPGAGSLGRVAGFCGSFGTLGASIGTNGPSSNLRISNLVLPKGWYAVKVEGTVLNGTGRFYSGNISTNPIPEPGSLALVALGLLAAGVAVRRKA